MTTTRQSLKPRHYLTDEGLEVASVWYQGGWIVRLQLSPDEFTTRRVATREYAEALAIRHAASL